MRPRFKDPHINDTTTQKVCGVCVVGKQNLEATYHLYVDQKLLLYLYLGKVLGTLSFSL